MTSDIWKLENDLCRCCHSKGVFHNLAEPCKLSGEEQNYVDMLRDSLHVYISPVPGDLCVVTYKICDTCVWQLRAAVKFKKQVMESEERFKDMYNRNFIKVADFKIPPEVKMELPDYSDDEYKEDNLQIDFHEDVPVIDIKVEDTKKVKAKKPKPKPKPKSKPKKPVKKVVKPKKDKVTLKVETKTDVDDEAEDDPEAESEALADAEAEDEALAIAEAQAEAGVETENADKKGGKTPPAPKFRLRNDDFTRDGDILKCARCDKTYDKMFSLKFHVKSKHYKIPRHTCPYCNIEFMTDAPFTVHKLEKHDVDDRYKCNACKGAFNTKVQLRKHINNFHMLGEKYKCQFCEYESFSFEGMYKHKFKHRTAKDFHCRFCRKSFLRKATLDLHERIHTGDRRKVCKICGQAFVQKASLNYHMTKYHPEVNF